MPKTIPGLKKVEWSMQDAAGRGAIKLVQVKGPDCDWQSMVNVWGAAWESTSVPQPPLDFRIQDDAGVEVRSISDGHL